MLVMFDRIFIVTKYRDKQVCGLSTVEFAASISWSHQHRTLEGARIGKDIRIHAAGVILICLPLAKALSGL